jgi:hypothetical protein
MHEDEKKVRDAWEGVVITRFENDKPFWIHSDSVYLGTGPFRTTDEMWSAAAAYTDKIKQQIAEIDEEMRLLDTLQSANVGYSPERIERRKVIYWRLIARLRDARAELRRGMRGEA